MGASYVILGDGVAGSSAAETIAEEDSDAEVTVVTDEGEPLYNRILIKEFAKGKLPEAPISIHDEEWYEERGIDLRLNTHVTAVDTEANALRTHEGQDIEYDRLLVATGGTPRQLPVENSDAEGVHHFWTFEDARAIREHAAEADTGVIVGAGLLGIDLAAICATQDIEAHYLMRGECWWRYALDPEGADIIHDALTERSVYPEFGAGASEFETEDGRVVATVDGDGERYESEFVGVAIGLDFNTEFLQDSPVETDDGVVVDEFMRTNVEDVYAAGDITKFHDVILDEQTQNGAWGSAKQQGTTAGRSMVADQTGEEGVEAFRWVPSYSITHFDFPFLSFGHPTIGDDDCSRKYSDTEYRRLAFKDGKLVGGVLIGDLSPQSHYKRLIREETPCADQKEILLDEEFDPENLATTPEQ
jgi:NAD(P)H-nitrite reductase large subunit